ncbi:MAG: HIT domain-containing protein [Armatimonadetes bacterium]|nr:HIT domain-containing protein [Armatimonadota bacterium]
MEKLWAPWRMAYIEIEAPAGCIFCDKPAQDRDEENLILYRGSEACVFLNLFPYNNGHLMVVPYQHIASLSELSGSERLEMMDLSARCTEWLKTAFHPDGFNVGINLGRVAGAGIADHLHIHVVPRWNGDTNFMPVLGDAKVLPDSLQNTLRKLRAVVDDQ